MCTLVILRRPGHDWPVLLAANRDEMAGRPWKPPARHWPDRDEVVGGIDLESGGSWLARNDHGVVAAILNRPGTLGPAPGKRTRGELVLDALDHADAGAAAVALADLDPGAYRPFNLVLADNTSAWWLAAREGARAIVVERIPEGLSILTAHDMNDPDSSRIARYLPLFREAAEPDPESGDWEEWQALLASRDTDDDHFGAMNIVTDAGFGTLSSSLIALPSPETGDPRGRWLFAEGRPGDVGYEAVEA
ncbi:MAG: NRDE family protein [Alphaproteobacteria bacterium]|nr:NRDE family protein [Alphaproteobacteria bacterium]